MPRLTFVSSVTFVLEACDDVEMEGEGEQSVPENPTVTTMKPLSPDSPWEPHREGVPDILAMGNSTPGSGQLHSNELSPQQQISRSYAIPPPTIDGPPVLSLRGASLMRNFIQQIAPWVSSTFSCLQYYLALTYVLE